MAKSSFEKLRELDLSRDEVERIGEALKQEEFRKLLVEYVEEIQNPENKKLYEEEIVQLEKERGNDVTFINPKPGYVIKTSIDGNQKCFVNVCANENIDRPSSVPLIKEGSRGLQWSLPHTLSPAREDLDNKGIRCQVFDVVFHPDTLHMALKNKPFAQMLNATACDAVEKNFGVKLDQKNLKLPKLTYKGLPRPSIIRKKSTNDESVERTDPEEREFFDKIYAQIDQQSNNKRNKRSPRRDDNKSKYTNPTYVIKHRSNVDIQEFLENKQAKINAATPKELIIEIDLPLLKSSSDITLDVTEKTLQLTSEKPSKYKLNLTLPYRVSQDNGNAKFDKDLKKLIITLPVKRNCVDCSYRDDSGVESDHGSPVTTPSGAEEFFSSEATKPAISDNNLRTNNRFLDDNLHYTLPDFTCHLFENILAFTLNVKNVDANSLEKRVINCDSLSIKFASVSSSFYQAHYAFFVKLPEIERIEKSNVQAEVWDNNVVIQIPFESRDGVVITHYFYGVDGDDLKQKFIEEPAILNRVLSTPDADVIPEETQTEIAQEDCKSKAINIVAASSYESSGDELSYSYSPSKSKGILKRLSSSNRGLVGRSISESSLDDFVYCSSLDSAIPEDGELSTSLKKTVRFSDVIMKQLYRSNSSILGQKKKNQRKARNKKRALERRHSESEASEVDDKKEELNSGQKQDDHSEESDNNNEFINNAIFHMDMTY